MLSQDRPESDDEYNPKKKKAKVATPPKSKKGKRKADGSDEEEGGDDDDTEEKVSNHPSTPALHEFFFSYISLTNVRRRCCNVRFLVTSLVRAAFFS